MDEQNDIPVQTIDELDDVEGHGLREVAAGAAIGAAVLGAGGVAFAATASSGPGPAPMMLKPPTIVSQTQDDANTLVNDATSGARGLAAQTLSDTQGVTGQTLAQVNSIAAPVVTTANDAVGGATNLATQTANDATTLTGHTVTAATGIVDQAVTNTLNTVGSVEHTALTTADAAVKTATDTVSSVESTAISVVNAVQDRVGQGWTLNLSILGENVGTGGNMLTPSGTVTVFDSDGTQVASANVINGAATVSFAAAGQAKSYTIHYGNLTANWVPPQP